MLRRGITRERGKHGDEVMGWHVLSPLGFLTLVATASLSAPLQANTVDRENCLAAEIAEIRGFEAMEGLWFLGEDGQRYTRGKLNVQPPFDPAVLKDPKIIALADKWTPGAIEYVDGWLIGYMSIGRDNKQVATEAAKEFISFYISCLDKFGPAGWR